MLKRLLLLAIRTRDTYIMMGLSTKEIDNHIRLIMKELRNVRISY